MLRDIIHSNDSISPEEIGDFEKRWRLDLGYYPEFEPHGRFVLKVAKSEDWEHPILRLESRDMVKPVKDLNLGAEMASKSSR